MGKKSNINEEFVISIFKELKSTTKTAQICNCSTYIVRRILKEYDMMPSMSESHMKYSCNENYFENIDNEHKAYWLGFLMADGCINERETSNRLILSLNIKDKNHIQKFKEDLESDGVISDYIIKSGIMKGKEYSTFRITSNKLTNDLSKIGCTPRKSLTLKFPTENIFKSKDLIRHFIRGYFDGDGSVFISKEKHWRNGTITNVIHYRFSGTKDFLEIIDKNLQLSGNIKQMKNNNAFELSYKRDKKLIPFFTYLYQDSTIYLNRKYEIFKKHIQERCSETTISQLNLS